MLVENPDDGSRESASKSRQTGARHSSADEYDAALAVWISEAATCDPVAASISAAEVLHGLGSTGSREHPMTWYVVPVAADGSISLPAEFAARWWGTTVVVADLGDQLVLRDVPASSESAMRGKYRGRGPSTLDVGPRDRDG